MTVSPTCLFHVHAGFETHHSLARFFPQGCVLGIILVLFTHCSDCRKYFVYKSAMASKLIHTAREHLSFFFDFCPAKHNFFFLFTCVYNSRFTVTTAVRAARDAVTLSVHQRTVLCPQQAQAAIWAQGVAQHPLGCVRPAYK